MGVCVSREQTYLRLEDVPITQTNANQWFDRHIGSVTARQLMPQLQASMMWIILMASVKHVHITDMQGTATMLVTDGGRQSINVALRYDSAKKVIVANFNGHRADFNHRCDMIQKSRRVESAYNLLFIPTAHAGHVRSSTIVTTLEVTNCAGNTACLTCNMFTRKACEDANCNHYVGTGMLLPSAV
jgi:hypothetical protein